MTSTLTGAASGAVAAEAPGDTRVWHDVCHWQDLLPDRGAAALIDDVQIALFRTSAGELFAIDNIDPYTGSAVLSRGIVGGRGAVPTVASPLHKQVFDLSTGQALDDPSVRVNRYDVRVMRERVEVAV